MGDWIMAFIGAFYWSTGLRATSISALMTLLPGLIPPPVGGYHFVRMERSWLILSCTKLQSARSPTLSVASVIACINIWVVSQQVCLHVDYK